VPIPSGQSRRASPALLWSATLGLGAALGPGPVWACPACVAQAPERAGTSALLLGAMLLTPFLLVAAGAWVAWRMARGDAAGKP
jgi:hypothetical protein